MWDVIENGCTKIYRKISYNFYTIWFVPLLCERTHISWTILKQIKWKKTFENSKESNNHRGSCSHGSRDTQCHPRAGRWGWGSDIGGSSSNEGRDVDDEKESHFPSLHECVMRVWTCFFSQEKGGKCVIEQRVMREIYRGVWGEENKNLYSCCLLSDYDLEWTHLQVAMLSVMILIFY